MNTPPATATRDGAFLAHVLADALSLGLPDPDYITMSPRYARSTDASAVDFQFNDRHGREPLPALHAWASRFGVTVGVDASDPSGTWHTFEFTHAGVVFHAYAKIVGADCACTHEHRSHWEHAEPDGPRKGCGILGCTCTAYDGGGVEDDFEAVREFDAATRGDYLERGQS